MPLCEYPRVVIPAVVFPNETGRAEKPDRHNQVLRRPARRGARFVVISWAVESASQAFRDGPAIKTEVGAQAR